MMRFAWLLAALVLLADCADEAPHAAKQPSRQPQDAGHSSADAAETTAEPDAASTGVQPADAAPASAAKADAAATRDAGIAMPARDAAPAPAAEGDMDAGSDTTAPRVDDARLFERDTLLEVELTLDAADWQRIRGEGRTLNEVFSYCIDPTFEYTTVHASARIADLEIAQLGLRKKGFLGSLSARRPSLRIDVDEYVKGQLLFGSKVVVLNNSLQDASYTHTCLAYQVFAAAGVPAPRCAFAHVRVNGADLGSYVHVEAVKKPFLARAFGDDSGFLYEGNGMTDFRPELLANFEKKTREDEPLAAPIGELTQLLAQPDDAQLLARLDALVDTDAFLRFWATEALVGHWDGYSGDLNNFYVYVHPRTNKLVFIPSGTDAAFERSHAYLRKQSRPQSVYAWARLANRLYAIPSVRERYLAALRELLANSWNETALLAEIDRIAALLGPNADAQALARQRTFVRNRRAELQAELDGPAAPEWTLGERPQLICQPNRNSAVSGAFTTTWGDLSAYAPNANNVLDVVLDGTRQHFAGVFASAGLDGDGRPTVQVGSPLSDGRLVAARFFLSEVPSGPAEVALQGFETYGAVVRGKNENDYALDGFIGSGKLVFERAAPASGSELSGHFEGQLVTLEPALAANYGKP
ncbi:MAG TPA: CotH kinase family protein [Polyangiales bacterium]|nr:CotH kinase family protein [Polyangiales bacterium]